eukprot:570482-Amphidinium_carterae.1
MQESAILHRCAAGRDKLDRELATDVEVLKVPCGSTGLAGFPRRWHRVEGHAKNKAHALLFYLGLALH